MARQVARVLGIPYYFLNHEQEFGARVVADFTREYAAGRTPSPCVVCNREIKFGTLLDRARAWDAEAVATGHYARVAPDPATGRVHLLTARDEAKDQSYFLWPLTQEQLARARFPIGGLSKVEVRARARARGLAAAAVPESQELCFVSGDYRTFLRARAPEAFRPGPDRGRGRSGDRRARWARRLHGGPAPRAGPDRAVARSTWSASTPRGTRSWWARARRCAQPASSPSGSTGSRSSAWRRPLAVEARVRHRAPRVPAHVVPRAPGEVEVLLEAPQYAVTPGQSVVFYRGEVVVGGGVIACAA